MAHEKAKSPLVAASEETKDSTQASLDKTLFMGGGNADAAMPVEAEDTTRRPSLAERLKAEQQRRGEKRADEAKAEESSEPSEPNAPKTITRSRRPAGPAQRRFTPPAANDDLPSIGGLIFALQQRPSKSPFMVALLASLAWFIIGGAFSFGLISNQLAAPEGAAGILSNAALFTAAVTIVIPIAIFWFLALLVWRAQELRLMASAMTEVAVRLAEPDKLAEQSVASLGQTIRRQVAAMNDAISRAIGRASELEALVHNEVAALERSYSENELRVRSLIGELATEREALANNSERVSEALKGVGAQIARDISNASGGIDKKLAERGLQLTELLVARSNEAAEQVHKAQGKVATQVPALLDRLGQEQVRLAEVIEGAAKNLSALDSAVAQKTTALESTLRERTDALNSSLTSRISALESSVSQGAIILDKTLKDRTDAFTAAVGQNAFALDKVLADRTAAFAGAVGESAATLDSALSERTTSLISSIGEGAAVLNQTLKLGADGFATAISQHGAALDKALSERTEALVTTIDERAGGLDKVLSDRADALAESIDQRTGILDKSLAERTDAFAASIEERANALDKSLHDRTAQFTSAVNQGAIALDKTLAERTDSFTNSLTQRIKALETTITDQAAAVDKSLAERTEAVTAALSERLKHIDVTFGARTTEVDRALTQHSQAAEATFNRQTTQLNQVLATNSDAMRQTADQVGAQSKEAVTILTNQTQTLREVSRGLLEQIHGLTQRFENQGQAILTAAKALDSSNSKIDSILEGRHQSILGLLHVVNTKAQDLDNVMRSYSGMVENSLTHAETRAKQVSATLARDTAGQAQQALAQIERLREEAQAHTGRAVADLKGSFETVITQIGRQLEQMRGQFDNTSRGMREAARQTATDLESLRQEMQKRMESLPQQTAQATAAIRKALTDQLREIEALTPVLTKAAPQGNGADPYRQQAPAPRSQPLPQPQPQPRAEEFRLARTFDRPAEEFDLPPMPRFDPKGRQVSPSFEDQADIGQVASSLAQQLSGASQQRGGARPEPRRSQWSVGDLLARASENEDASFGAPNFAGRNAPPPASNGAGGALRLDELARAIDPRTASEVWQRFRTGERGVLGRHIYSLDGQVTFDELSRRYERDGEFRGTVDRYIGDFERLLAEAEQTDPDGRILQNYLTSETGRVYLLLAHSSGRLR